MVFCFHLLPASFGYEQLPWNGLFPGQPESRSFYLLYPLSYGNLGVAVFFVISGFCIHLNYVRNRQQGWTPFFIRRFFRIYPPYLVAVLLFFFLYGWSRQEDAGRQLFTHLLVVHNFDEKTVFGISPAFWSIGVEIQLYLLYPVLVFAADKVGWSRALMGTALIEGILRISAAGQTWTGLTWMPNWIQMSPIFFWFSWALGAQLAESHLENKESWLARVPPWPFLFLALAGSWFKPLLSFQFTAAALVTAVVVERLMTKKWTIPFRGFAGLAWSHLAALGIVSYSFYLLHQPLMSHMWDIAGALFSEKVHPLLRCTVCLLWYPVLFLASKAYFLMLEKPSIASGKNLLEKLGFR